jgi:hypothetical protein
LAKANKENSIMIGDSLDADVQGALDMGLDAIFFNTDKVQVEQEKTSQSFIRIKKIFITMRSNKVLLFISSFGFSQSVNDYKAVIVPIKYEFTSTDNQYRLATISKYNLNNAGFEAFYDNESVTEDYKDRCSLLYYDIVKENAFLTTKVHITLKDCYGKVVLNQKQVPNKSI